MPHPVRKKPYGTYGNCSVNQCQDIAIAAAAGDGEWWADVETATGWQWTIGV
jgi:hypothetical protein